MWKDLKIVHGMPRHSQSQGSVERANQDNKTKKWNEGIKFVQFMKNRSFHHGIKSSPYEAMFGSRAKIGLNNCILPMHVVEKFKTEEDLEKALNTIEEEENKEKNKESNEVIIEENVENYNSEDAYLNSRKLSIQTKRNESVQNLEKQANKMKSLSERRFCEGNIGDSVKIKIPDVDRARSDLRSILAVIISSIINNNILIIICCLMERANRTIVTLLSMSTDDQRRWDTKVSEVERLLNAAENKTTKKTQFAALHGYQPRFHKETLGSLPNTVMIGGNQQRLYNRKHVPGISLDLGEMVVMLKAPAVRQPTKLQSKYREKPLQVIQKLPGDTYRVAEVSPEGQTTFATTAYISQLKSWKVLDQKDYLDGTSDEDSDEATVADECSTK
ncbi:KRAB-A domain-containing protein 2-like [Aphis craccivora]|uniref:KRAB-A domain-containing protein 2-like n=1 Tax=Aphis craccivora TaxID=307492 RepID=A0A6G0Y989_APHCR|nr:KRAB-A domain-containing protein 2-like [Aphis craccivora]